MIRQQNIVIFRDFRNNPSMMDQLVFHLVWINLLKMHDKLISGACRYMKNRRLRLETEEFVLSLKQWPRFHCLNKMFGAVKGLVTVCLLLLLMTSGLVGCMGFEEGQPAGFGVNVRTPCSYALSIDTKSVAILHAICDKEGGVSINMYTNMHKYANNAQNVAEIASCKLFSSDSFDFGVYVRVRRNVYVRKWIFNATFDRVRIMHASPPKFEWITTNDGVITTKPDMWNESTYISAEHCLSPRERDVVISMFNPFRCEEEERAAWEAGGGVVETVIW